MGLEHIPHTGKVQEAAELRFDGSEVDAAAQPPQHNGQAAHLLDGA